MLIKSLRMVNFRQFKGDVHINFSCDKNKNVTVILGDNTFGKTTLLQAFNWCLYNEVKLPHKEMLLNYEDGEDMPEGEEHEAVVEIVLIHKNQEYTIARKQKFKKSYNRVVPLINSNLVTMSYKDRDGNTVMIKEEKIPQTINNILPKDLSSYFFFDTERVQDVSERKDLANAVKGLLGLSVLDNGIRHLGEKGKKTSVIGKFYQALGQYSGNKEIPEMINRIEELTNASKDLKQNVEEYKKEIECYERNREQLDRQLAKNENSKELQQQRLSIEYEIKNTEHDIRSKTVDLQKYLSTNLKFFLVQPLIDEALKMIKRNPVNDRGIEGLTASVLKGILSRGTCVCGQKIVKGNDAYKHIMEEIKYVPPASIGTAVKSYKSLLFAYRNNGESVQGSVNRFFESISKNQIRYDDLIDRRNDLADKLANIPDMSRTESERRQVVKRIRDLQDKITKINQEIGQKENEITMRNKYVQTHSGDNQQIEKINRCIAYAEEVLAWIQKSYNEEETNTRQRLQDKVTLIFNKMYTGRRRVVIDDKYQVHLITEIPSTGLTDNQSERETGDSEGLLRVKNFAFIAGLVALAKEKIVTDIGESTVDLSSEPYPLVMDAPFSNADENHTKNISRILPEVAEQVIMFVMRKDWNYAEKVMNDKVGAMYKLKKISETNTKLELI